MKRFIILAAAAIIATTTFAHQSASTIHLRLSDNSPMVVYLDGQQINGNAGGLEIPQVQAGRHFLQVFKVNQRWGRQSLESAYRGKIDVPPFSRVLATIDPWSRQIFYDQIADMRTIRDRMQEREDHCRYPGRSNQYPDNTVYCPEPAVNPAPVCNNPVIYPMPMDPASFGNLKATINNAAFESTKLSILKQALPYNNFTTTQVVDLMNIFAFESYRLEVAKLMYPQTLDQQNYYIVNNAFSFNSSINDLQSYIAML